jgi:hypothetical protein
VFSVEVAEWDVGKREDDENYRLGVPSTEALTHLKSTTVTNAYLHGTFNDKDKNALPKYAQDLPTLRQIYGRLAYTINMSLLWWSYDMVIN